jgi:hypothetical protein
MKRKSKAPHLSLETSDQKLLREINSTKITTEDIIKVVKHLQTMPTGERGFEGTAIATIMLFPRKHAKGQAITFRLGALAHLVTSLPLPGWVVEQADRDGPFWTSAPVFAAAASQPLMLSDGQLRFDPQTFKDAVIALAELSEES